MDPDLELVRGMAAGDTGALEALYERHARALLRYLYGQLRDDRLAEEALQDVMLSAWHGAERFRGESRVLSWLMRIAHNQAIDIRRKRRAEVSAVDPVEMDQRNTAAPRLSQVDDRQDLAVALRVLPPEQLAVLELVFFHGFSVAETAEVLDVAPGTVKSRLYRARQALKDQLEVKDATHG